MMRGGIHWKRSVIHSNVIHGLHVWIQRQFRQNLPKFVMILDSVANFFAWESKAWRRHAAIAAIAAAAGAAIAGGGATITAAALLRVVPMKRFYNLVRRARSADTVDKL